MIMPIQFFAIDQVGFSAYRRLLLQLFEDREELESSLCVEGAAMRSENHGYHHSEGGMIRTPRGDSTYFSVFLLEC